MARISFGCHHSPILHQALHAGCRLVDTPGCRIFLVILTSFSSYGRGPCKSAWSMLAFLQPHVTALARMSLARQAAMSLTAPVLTSLLKACRRIDLLRCRQAFSRLQHMLNRQLLTAMTRSLCVLFLLAVAAISTRLSVDTGVFTEKQS